VTSWNSSRRKGLRDLGEAWFWCNDCPKDVRRWQFGGQDSLAKHRRLVHGVDEWPDYDTVDSDLFVVDGDGNPLLRDDQPVKASTAKGWIKTRPTKPRLYDRGGR
jgi:hypothetical protein